MSVSIACGDYQTEDALVVVYARERRVLIGYRAKNGKVRRVATLFPTKVARGALPSEVDLIRRFLERPAALTRARCAECPAYAPCEKHGSLPF